MVRVGDSMIISKQHFKKWFLDGLANYVFFVPIVVCTTGFAAHWTWYQLFLYLTIGSVPVGFLGGAGHGRFLNYWRKWCHYT